MSNDTVFVAHDTLAAGAEGTWAAAKGNKLGFQIVMDFYTQMALEGRVYQVRAGTISVPLVGDIVITDTAAEMAADVTSGTTIIPVQANLSLNLVAQALFESGLKSVATVSSSGTAFTPLNLKSDGVAAASSARVQAAGAVTVTAELATTTLRHWSVSSPIAFGAQPSTFDWNPTAPPVLVGPRSFYWQIATGATAGPSYFAHFDYIELPTANIS